MSIINYLLENNEIFYDILLIIKDLLKNNEVYFYIIIKDYKSK